jgi:protein-tyrosine-phosphatase
VPVNRMSEEQRQPTLKDALRRMVPVSWLKEREIFLRLGPKAGPIYAQLRLKDIMGMGSANAAKVAPQSRSFLFVCFGNIMRSPMAEALLRKSAANLPEIQVASAGLHALPGNAAHPNALAASAEIGLPLAHHRAQVLTRELVSQADVIFAMDFQNQAELLAAYPQHRQKILLLSAYADGVDRYREIPDPYLGDLDTTRRCYSLLQACIRNLTAELTATVKERANLNTSAAVHPARTIK